MVQQEHRLLCLDHPLDVKSPIDLSLTVLVQQQELLSLSIHTAEQTRPEIDSNRLSGLEFKVPVLAEILFYDDFLNVFLRESIDTLGVHVVFQLNLGLGHLMTDVFLPVLQVVGLIELAVRLRVLSRHWHGCPTDIGPESVE